MRKILKRRSPSTGRVAALVVHKRGGEVQVGPGNVLLKIGKLLDQQVRSDADVVRLVANGLPARSLTQLSVKVKGAGQLIAPGTTVRRRLSEQARFTTTESERMVRLARVYALAVDVFGDEDRAEEWLHRPVEYLAGQDKQSPLELAVTDPGARMVEGMLLKTQHGIF